MNDLDKQRIKRVLKLLGSIPRDGPEEFICSETELHELERHFGHKLCRVYQIERAREERERLRSDVSVLFVDPLGVYPSLVADWWDAERDARHYAGPNPIVAHPPCGPWGRLRHQSKRPQDRDLAPLAIEMVRKHGGVLEHPSSSTLWEHCQLPLPGWLPDVFGGYTIEVCQCDWGHVARKRTWLYLVGVPNSALRFPPSREPTHWIAGRLVPPNIKVCSAQQRRRTPVEFAKYLINLAAASR